MPRPPGLVVLGLPLGGVVVADEVARALEAPLDVIRKRRAPGDPEVGLGAPAPPMPPRAWPPDEGRGVVTAHCGNSGSPAFSSEMPRTRAR